MPGRRQYTWGIACSGLAIVAALGYVGWQNSRVSAKPESLLLRLPTADAAVLGIDVALLRAGGFLQFLGTSKTQEEREYTNFVRDSGFDYKRDLDYALLSFAPDGTFFLVKGTFDWPKLEAYALKQKGSCFEHLCRLDGSTAQRHISFFPLRHDVLAMAVAPDDTAAARLTKLGPQSDIEIPRQPVWLSLSAGALRHSAGLPGSSKLFASAITDANRVTLTLGPAAGSTQGEIEAHLEAICRDAQQAGALTGQLTALTTMLRTAAQREGKAGSDADLGGLLASGTFQQAGTHVLGRWPVKKALIGNLTGGL